MWTEDIAPFILSTPFFKAVGLPPPYSVTPIRALCLLAPTPLQASPLPFASCHYYCWREGAGEGKPVQIPGAGICCICFCIIICQLTFSGKVQVTLQLRVIPFRFSVKIFLAGPPLLRRPDKIFFHLSPNPLSATVVIIPRITVSPPNWYLLACLYAFLLCSTRRLPRHSYGLSSLSEVSHYKISHMRTVIMEPIPPTRHVILKTCPHWSW